MQQSTLTRSIVGICLVISSVAMLPAYGSTPSVTTSESQQLITNMIRQIESTMAAVSNIEANAGNDVSALHLSIALPATMSTNLGMIMDTNDAQGFRVLTVSPQSFAETLGLISNDVITAINGIVSSEQDRNAAFAVLEELVPGEEVTLSVDRNGEQLTLTGFSEGVFTPAISIELGGNDAGLSQAATDIETQDTCGKISTFHRPPRTRDLYSAYITEIGEDTILRGRHTFNVAPGTYEVLVHELIDSARLTRRAQILQNAKSVTIEVKPDTIYYVAARFIPENRNKQRDGEYWEPVVWKVKENSTCSR